MVLDFSEVEFAPAGWLQKGFLFNFIVHGNAPPVPGAGGAYLALLHVGA